MRVGVAVIACLLIAIVLGFISVSPGSGPTYQGRTARSWMRIYFSGYSGHSRGVTNEEVSDAKRAIRAMGTNVIPYAVRLVSKGYPKFLRSFYDNADGTGYEILEILGTNARPAAPALIKLTKNPESEVRSRALYMLLEMDLDKQIMVPVLISMTRDPVPRVRETTIQKFLTWYPEEAKIQGFTWEALDAETRRRAESEAAVARARKRTGQTNVSLRGSEPPTAAIVPSGYRAEVMRLLAEEASRVAGDLGLAERLPIKESDLTAAYIPPPDMARRLGAIGNISTSNYTYFMSVGNKFSFLDRANLQSERQKLKQKYQWPINKIDTNAAHDLATQLLARASMDVRAIERDCDVTVVPFRPEGARGEWFVPLYWVYWVKRGEDRPVASVELVQPTRAVHQLRVERPEYIARKPVEILPPKKKEENTSHGAPN
jgi:hypothetical protein